ncbi:AzlC family ABC transporter permease [Polymorphum gilvum]|uniref:Probable branched-chain amino acid transport protein AzlC n=1 Tax=Polymorphum gilvum (strain LMG 25793 / CGMCC 1.9160 / SL003B-26A1) TaxID=991905 RepID=F2J0Y2_POLGS|nr:AzlC family ABC transporter permease [Polymorphum gilvum]ADZ71928.1 Probable branched-chain amino acid transport protein AzlC [Polymorphum gilvum SL003B-26A1]
MTEPTRITLAGTLLGARLTLPVLPGTVVFAAVFGTVAAQKGLSFLETLLINSVVFAGASQFVAMEVYAAPLTLAGLLAMVGVTAAVNLRMLLIGASLRPWLGTVPGLHTYPALFLLTDINWLIALRHYNEGGRDWGVYLGSGLAIWVVWSASVVPGYFLGALLADPGRYGLDLVMPAFFTALLVPLWKGRRQTVSWGLAGVVAWGTWATFGGYWGILTGALAGALAGAFVDD